MKENSRIRFNPATKEIEIEGSERFVKTYFDKITEMLSSVSLPLKVESKGATIHPAQQVAEEPPTVIPRKKIRKPAKRKGPEEQQPKPTMFDTVVGLIRKSDGITTTELKNETGMTEKQIWSITYQAERLGKIKRAKRGVYIAVD